MSIRTIEARTAASRLALAYGASWLLAGGVLLLGAPAIGLAQTAPAAEDAPLETAPEELEGVTVWGRRREEIGVATSASEGVVGFADFAQRPLLRPGELAEVVPGLAATQHSGTGKANQFFLRGFNLDHGTDFSVSFDGVPLNLRTHAHGQGYLDLNGITPELVETIRYRKGPYWADLGDFSSAGAAEFATFDEAPGSFIEAQAGENAYARVLGVAALGPTSYAAVDLTTGDGPWVRPEDFRKGVLFGRFGLGNWSVSALVYGSQWNSTDQIPARAVEQGLISRLGTIDTTDGGRTSRFILSARRRSDDGLEALAYAQRYRLNLWSNFTYFLADPVNGDQFEQADHRWVYGGAVSKVFDRPVAGWTVRAGADARYDDIESVGLYLTRARERLETVREDGVDQVSGGAWIEAGRAFGPVRVTGGLRTEAMRVEVRSDDPANSGEAHDALLSPKLALAWRVSDRVELYGNVGRGFHSNDARGATARIDPATGEPTNAVELYAPGSGGELGARYQRRGLTATAALWGLGLDSELVYVGDAGATEPAGATRRLGAEVLVDWTPVERINLNFAAAATDARFTDDPPGGDRIPNALEYVVTGGVSAEITSRTTATVTVRRLGPAPLVEDGSVMSNPSTLANALVRHRLGRVSLDLEVLNLFDSRDDDIEYFYASRLPGEPDEGVEDLHLHPFEPRTVRVGLRLSL